LKAKTREVAYKMIYTNDYESPLGNILLAGDEQGLTGLWFTEGGRYIGVGLKEGAIRRKMDYFDQTKEWLDIYFSGRDPGFFPRIHLVGSDFRNRVGEIMCGIPYGKTVTYGWIAEKWQKSADWKGCPHRQLAARSAIIRSASSYRATGWSERTGT